MNFLPAIHRCSALLGGTLFAGALSCCGPRATKPANPSPSAEARTHEEPPTVPVLPYRPHPEADAAARAEYDRIDAELVAHFDYETGHQPVFASVEDFFGGWLPVGRFGRWQATVEQRDAYETRIDRVIETQPSPTLTVLALARRGSLSDSMWRGLFTLEETGFAPVSPALHAAVVHNEGDAGLEAVQETERFIQEGFNRWRESWMAELVERAVAGYAWAAVIARRYGVAFAPVRKRLEFFRAQVGAKQFAEIVYAAPPPPGLAASYQRLVENDLGLLPPVPRQ